MNPKRSVHIEFIVSFVSGLASKWDRSMIPGSGLDSEILVPHSASSTGGAEPSRRPRSLGRSLLGAASKNAISIPNMQDFCWLPEIQCDLSFEDA